MSVPKPSKNGGSGRRSAWYFDCSLRLRDTRNYVRAPAMVRNTHPKERIMRKLMDAMARDVEVIGPETTLAEAAARMHELDIGALPVSENDQIIGMLTDRDIVIRSVAEGRDPMKI